MKIAVTQNFLQAHLYLSNTLEEKYIGSEFPHKRMMMPPIDLSLLQNIDFYLSTHGHTDHMDPGSIESIYKENRSVPIFICPRSQLMRAVERKVPIEKLLGINSDESYSLRDKNREIISIHAVPAAHEQISINEFANHEALGYIIKVNGITLYHSGDCIPYEGLTERLKEFQIDLALLPVNGRNEYLTKKGIAGNFTIDEASALAHDAGISIIIPHHYGMFDFNTISPKEVEKGLISCNWNIGKNAVVTSPGVVYTIG